MLGLLGLLLMLFLSGRLNPDFLYALSIREDDKTNWVELPEYKVILSQYFLQGDDDLLESYRVQETEHYYFMGEYGKSLLRPSSGNSEIQDQEDSLGFFGRIRSFAVALFRGDSWNAGTAQIFEDPSGEVASPELILPEGVEEVSVTSDVSVEDILSDESFTEEDGAEDTASEFPLSDDEETPFLETISAEEEGTVITDESEVSPLDLVEDVALPEDTAPRTFSEKIKNLSSDRLTVPERIVLESRRQLLQEADDVLFAFGKDFSLQIDAYSPFGDLDIGFQPKEGYRSSFQRGMIHFEKHDSVVSYFYDRENRVLKEWIFLPSLPGQSFQFDRTLETAEYYQVKKMINGDYFVWDSEKNDHRSFIVSHPRLIRAELSDLAAPIFTYYNSGTFSLVFDPAPEINGPFLIEREWRAPSVQELSLMMAGSPDDLEKAKSQRLFDLLQTVPFSFEANAGQYSSDVLFSANKNYASYFLKEREIISNWFLPSNEQGPSPINVDFLSQGEMDPASNFGYGYDPSFETDERKGEVACRESRPLLSRLLRENDQQYVLASLRQMFVQPSGDLEVSSIGIDRISNHYYQGNDFAQWFTGVESALQILYKNLYEGIDLIIGSDETSTTQIFVVQSGASAETIRWRFRGAEKVSLMKNGDLLVDTGICQIGYEKPYAIFEGEDLKFFDVKYSLIGSEGISFEIPAYSIGKDYSLFVKVSEQRTNCLKAPLLEKDIAIVPVSSDTYYIAGNSSTRYRFPLQLDDYQCISGNSFDPVIRLVDLENRKILFKTVFGGEKQDLITSLTLHMVALSREEDSSIEVFVDDQLTGYFENERSYSALDLLLSENKITLLVEGETQSDDFPGVDYLMGNDSSLRRPFSIEIDEQGFIFLDDVNLITLVQPQPLERQEKREPLSEPEETENLIEQVEEGVMMGSAIDELMEGDLKGAAESGVVAAREDETSFSEESTTSSESEVAEVPTVIQAPTLEEIFSGRLDQLIQNPFPERFELDFIRLQENLYEIRFIERETGILRASLHLDLSKLAQELNKQGESRESTQEDGQTSFWRWILKTHAQDSIGEEIDVEDDRDSLFRLKQLVDENKVKLDLSTVGFEIESDDFRVVVRQNGPIGLFEEGKTVYLKNVNRGAGLIICPDARTLEAIVDHCQGRVVLNKSHFGKVVSLQRGGTVAREGIVVQLVNSDGNILDYESSSSWMDSYYQISGIREGGTAVYGFTLHTWLDLPPFVSVKKEVILNYEKMKGAASSLIQAPFSTLAESESSFVQGTLSVSQLRENGQLLSDSEASSLDPDKWIKPLYDQNASEIKDVEFQQQGFFQSLLFSPTPVLQTESDIQKYSQLSAKEILALNSLERESILALKDPALLTVDRDAAYIDIAKDFNEGIIYRNANSELHLKPLHKSPYLPYVEYGVVHFLNESTNNEIISYYYNSLERSQKEWIVLANRPDLPYEYRWTLENSEKYQVVRARDGGFVIFLRDHPSVAPFRILPVSFIDGNGDVNVDQVSLSYSDGIFVLRLLDQERIVFPIAIDPTIQLNTGVTSLALGMDLTSQITGLNPGETLAYQWTFDPDGAGGLPQENFMKFNVPFNSGSTQRDLSGNSGTNGIVTNAVLQTSGCQVGVCMSFDGNGDYVTFPDSSAWNFSDEVTLSAWYSTTQSNTNGQAIVSQGSAWNQYSILLWASGSTSDDNVSFYIQTNPSGVVSVSCNRPEGTLFDGSWHHYVGTYKRSSNELKMYVDGDDAGCGVTSVPDEPLKDLDGGFHIGRLPFSTSYLAGKVDEVQAYSRALTVDQIGRLYQDGSGGMGGRHESRAEKPF